LFLAPLEALIAEVERLRDKDAASYTRKNAAKRLAAIAKLAFDIIPQAPARPEYRQGATPGSEHKHWCRPSSSRSTVCFSVTIGKAKSSFMPG
jgi:toxin YhaV